MTVDEGTASMSTAAEPVPPAPPAELRFRRRVGMGQALPQLWRSRGLVRTLAERSLRVRYKRAYLGVGWAVISPVGLLVAFTFVFHRAAHVATSGIPYPLYAYLGLLPWTFFASSFSNGASSILGDKPLLNKVYFPREVLPLSSVAVAAVDALVACVVLVALFSFERFVPQPEAVFVPLILLIMLAFVTGLVLALSALTVYVRDLRLALPLVLQFGLFITPVGYSFDAVPERLRPIYSFVNPLGPVIDNLRRTVLLGVAPRWSELGIAAFAAGCALVGGYMLFKRLETDFADIA